MLNYVNQIEATCPSDKSSIILSLNQISPDFNSSIKEDDEYIASQKENVASIVMDIKTAYDLINSIMALLEDETSKENE